MSDDDEPPAYEDAHLFAGQVAPMAEQVRAAFKDGSGLSRGKILKLFRSWLFFESWKGAIEDACGANPEATRGEVVEHVRELYMGYYARVAGAAGLEDLDRRSYINSARRGFDLAAGGGEATPLPVTLKEPDPALQAEKALEVRAAFDRPPAEIAGWLDALYRDLVSRAVASRLVTYADNPIRHEVFHRSFMAGLLRLAVDAKLSDPEAEAYTATVRRAFADSEHE